MPHNRCIGRMRRDCFSDVDGDLICDRDTSGTLIDDCVGSFDQCGICNGTSQYLRSGASANQVLSSMPADMSAHQAHRDASLAP